MQRGADRRNPCLDIWQRLQDRHPIHARNRLAHQLALAHQQRIEANQIRERWRFKPVRCVMRSFAGAGN